MYYAKSIDSSGSKLIIFVADKYIKAECPCMTARYTVALLACFGFSIMFGMRCNMSMAKLKMTEKGNVSSHREMILLPKVLLRAQKLFSVNIYCKLFTVFLKKYLCSNDVITS